MKGFSMWILGAAIVAMMSFQTGCATRGTLSAVEQERDQLQLDLEAVNAQLEDADRRMAAIQAAADDNAARSAALIRSLEAEVAAGQVAVRNAANGVNIDVSDALLFDSGSATLSQEGRAVLKRIASELNRMDGDVSVEGHTDSYMVRESLRGRYPSNWELGASRAAKVVRRLSAEGVDPKRFRVVSHGPFQPVAQNDTPAGRRMNRRIAIVLY